MPRTGLNWTPAGYLPAPLPARFISEAEQAAAKLPPTIKAQSLKNALLKGGAKPVELEYAGLDDFIASRQGQPVSAQDVLDHIKAQGPLGQLKRVEQQTGQYGPPDLGEDSPLTREEMEELGIAPRLPAYAPNMRKPFDPETASELTQYHAYTVPGKRGDFTGYREVLIEDPKNRAGKRSLVGESEGAVNAHASDYWARYNEYPDRVAVQNIQSDAGQDFSKGAKGEDDATALNGRLREVRGQRALLLTELNDSPSLTPDQRADAERQIDGLNEEEGEIFRTAQGRFAMEFDQNGDEYFTGAAITSPLARDDNWKNLMARHIALQSIAGGGKPITIPTGRQMVDVEGFGLGTHGDSGRAAKSATAYNEDLVRRLQKIFRGLDPSGAEVAAGMPVQVVARDDVPKSLERMKAFRMQLVPHLEGVLVARGRAGVDVNRLREADAAANQALSIAERDAQHVTPETLARLRDARRASQDAWQARMAYENPSQARNVGLQRSQQIDEKIYHIIQHNRERSLLEYLLNRGTPSPEFQDAAMRVIQHERLMSEMGPPAHRRADQSDNLKDSDAPGWTITPSPQSVRAALEKGLPIMSLAPLLLAPGAEERR